MIKLAQFRALPELYPLPKMELGNLVGLVLELGGQTTEAECKLLNELLLEIGRRYVEFNLKVDTREQEEMIRVASELGFSVSCQNIGDLTSKNVGFERKGSDYFSSVYSGRVFQQLHELKENYDYCYLIIDKTLEEVDIEAMRHNVSDVNVDNTIASFCIRGFPPIFAGSKERVARLVRAICIKANDGKDRNAYTPIRQKRMPTVIEQQTAFVASLPGVSMTIAQRLLEKFKTPQVLANASEEQLQEVEGIGAKKANDIYRTFHDPVGVTPDDKAHATNREQSETTSGSTVEEQPKKDRTN